MLTIRCTQKLLRKKLGPLAEESDSISSALGEWHANLVRLSKTPVVLCVNDRTLLAVLLPGKDFPNLFSVFRTRLIRRLERLGVRAEDITLETAAMEHIRAERTNSRSVLGSMNDFANQLKWYVAEGFDFPRAEDLEDRLAESPMSALNYESPDDAARTAFGLDKFARVEKTC